MIFYFPEEGSSAGKTGKHKYGEKYFSSELSGMIIIKRRDKLAKLNLISFVICIIKLMDLLRAAVSRKGKEGILGKLRSGT